MKQLAINGGKPVRQHLLPYGQQWLDDDDINRVLQVLKSDYLTQGPQISQFEQKVAQVAQTKYAVAFTNGTAALHGACFAAGISKGDEVITSPLTFAASSNCVLYQGGTPVFADVNADTYLIDLEEIHQKLTSCTKAIIPVDFAGQPIDMRKFQAFAKENGLVTIQDAAHSLGALFQNEPVGSIADMTMFSFHPVKPVTTGEGGIIVTNNEEYYGKLLLFRSHGITRDPRFLQNMDEGPWYYEMQELGYNYRMTDLQAALGISQIDKLESFISKRNEIATAYTNRLQPLVEDGLLDLPQIQEGAYSGWHLYCIQLKLDRFQGGRREIFNALRAENIGVNVHYVPVYLHPYYQSLGYTKGLCPKAEMLYESFITLPLFPKMTNGDINEVVEALQKVLNFFKN